MIRSILTLAVVVAGANLAGAAELEQAADQASALSAQAKAVISGPCREHLELEAASFTVSFPAGAPKGGAAEYTARFKSCEVEDYYYGEEIEPRAIRRYVSDDNRFGVVLTTDRGADKSSIDLSASIGGFQQRTAYVGDGANQTLVSSALTFTGVQVMDIEGIGGVMRPRDVVISPAEAKK